ncbi:Asp23/Gls24 family envelope stress response protein [Pseudonocardia spinosispora]|uniref:Asp23/Gls24 family envelope stress response protein n=1 Tax=Pseudonocardia spinosispora TaxID=103441 RepID=UPI000A04C944|nr:Asp23/Gls24 family envelope stress response protein [Pseudonocardia spinosispora]
MSNELPLRRGDAPPDDTHGPEGLSAWSASAATESNAVTDVEIDIEVTAAAVAATAARATVGVARLQPGVWGLVQKFSQQMWERATGKTYPDTAGVEVTLDGDTIAVEVTLVLHGGYQAAAVADAVQQAVPPAVTAATGLAVSTVTVRITDIDLTPLLA